MGTLGGGGHPPASPVFFAVQQGKAQLRGREPEKLFGLCRAGCGIPRHTSGFGLIFPGASELSEELFGLLYQGADNQASRPGHFCFLVSFRCLGQQPEQLFALLPGVLLDIFYKFFYI